MRTPFFTVCYVVYPCFCYVLIDIDDCADVTCTGHGTCTDLVNDYTCNCDSGYTGKNCETGRCYLVVFAHYYPNEAW